jgi:hypothetical protein
VDKDGIKRLIAGKHETVIGDVTGCLETASFEHSEYTYLMIQAELSVWNRIVNLRPLISDPNQTGLN